MQLLTSNVGKKVTMAISGILIILFVVLHLLGNSMSPYALDLPDLGKLMVVIKIGLLVLLAIHVALGVVVTIENNLASPSSYVVRKRLKATMSSETMIWSGFAILAFLVIHVLQFRYGVLSAPGFDEQARYLVLYLFALLALFMHLYHGIGSFFQTMGWNTACNKPAIDIAGRIVSLVLFAGFIAIVFLNR